MISNDQFNKLMETILNSSNEGPDPNIIDDSLLVASGDTIDDLFVISSSSSDYKLGLIGVGNGLFACKLDDPNTFYEYPKDHDSEVDYLKSTSQIVSNLFSNDELLKLGRQIIPISVNLIKTYYPKLYKALMTFNLAINPGISTLRVGYNPTLDKVSLEYNPSFVAEGAITEFVSNARRSNAMLLKNLTLNDFTVFISCLGSFYFMHEVYHVIYRHVADQSNDLPHGIENTIEDSYINNNLLKIYSNNIYLKQVLSKMGIKDLKVYNGITTKYTVSGHVEPKLFEALDIGDDGKPSVGTHIWFFHLKEIDKQTYRKLSNLLSVWYQDSPGTDKLYEFITSLKEDSKIDITCQNININRPYSDFRDKSSTLINSLIGNPRDSNVTKTPGKGPDNPVPGQQGQGSGNSPGQSSQGQPNGTGSSSDQGQSNNDQSSDSSDQEGNSQSSDDSTGNSSTGNSTGDQSTSGNTSSGSTDENNSDGSDSTNKANKDSTNKDDSNGSEEGSDSNNDSSSSDQSNSSSSSTKSRSFPSGQSGNSNGSPFKSDKSILNPVKPLVDIKNMPDKVTDNSLIKDAARELAHELAKSKQGNDRSTTELTQDDLDSLDPSIVDYLNDKPSDKKVTKGWRLKLKTMIEDATGIRIEYNADAPNPRIEGQFGRESIHEELGDLVLSFDISGSMHIDDFKSALVYIEDMMRMNLGFDRVGFVYWSTKYYDIKPRSIPPKRVYSKAKENYPGSGGGTYASCIVNPFLEGKLRSCRPDLVIIFTDGQIWDDTDEKQKAWIKRNQRRILWVLTPDGNDADIKDFDPSCKRRVVKMTDNKI